MKAVGARLPRYDGVGHVTGQTRFVDDVRVAGTLWAKAVRSPVHHAAITSVDTSKAGAMPGVHAIVTWEDVPCSNTGTSRDWGIPADEPLLAKDEVRYKGQPIALVVAEDEETAQAGVDAVEVGYEERPALLDVRKAFDEDSPRIHQWGNWYTHFEEEMDVRQIRKGDIDQAFEDADKIVAGTYRSAAIEQAPVENTGVSRRTRAGRPPHDLLVHAGALLHAWCSGSPPSGPVEQDQTRRRHRWRRVRRQGGLCDRHSLRPRCHEDGPAGQVAVDS